MTKQPPKELSPAKQKLLEIMRETRARLGPELIQKAAHALQSEKKAPPPSGASRTGKNAIPADCVPYDKKSASLAIRAFLDNHKNAAAFEKKLIERLKNEEKPG